MESLKQAHGSGKPLASVDTIKNQYGGYVREWRKRKRACEEMIEMVLENVKKNKKTFMKEQGLEGDEEHKVDLKQHLTVAEQFNVLKVQRPVKQFIRQ